MNIQLLTQHLKDKANQRRLLWLGLGGSTIGLQLQFSRRNARLRAQSKKNRVDSQRKEEWTNKFEEFIQRLQSNSAMHLPADQLKAFMMELKELMQAQSQLFWEKLPPNARDKSFHGPKFQCSNSSNDDVKFYYSPQLDTGLPILSDQPVSTNVMEQKIVCEDCMRDHRGQEDMYFYRVKPNHTGEKQVCSCGRDQYSGQVRVCSTHQDPRHLRERVEESFKPNNHEQSSLQSNNKNAHIKENSQQAKANPQTLNDIDEQEFISDIQTILNQIQAILDVLESVKISREQETAFAQRFTVIFWAIFDQLHSLITTNVQLADLVAKVLISPMTHEKPRHFPLPEYKMAYQCFNWHQTPAQYSKKYMLPIKDEPNKCNCTVLDQMFRQIGSVVPDCQRQLKTILHMILQHGDRVYCSEIGQYLTKYQIDLNQTAPSQKPSVILDVYEPSILQKEAQLKVIDRSPGFVFMFIMSLATIMERAHKVQEYGVVIQSFRNSVQFIRKWFYQDEVVEKLIQHTPSMNLFLTGQGILQIIQKGDFSSEEEFGKFFSERLPLIVSRKTAAFQAQGCFEKIFSVGMKSPALKGQSLDKIREMQVRQLQNVWQQRSKAGSGPTEFVVMTIQNGVQMINFITQEIAEQLDGSILRQQILKRYNLGSDKFDNFLKLQAECMRMYPFFGQQESVQWEGKTDQIRQLCRSLQYDAYQQEQDRYWGLNQILSVQSGYGLAHMMLQKNKCETPRDIRNYVWTMSRFLFDVSTLFNVQGENRAQKLPKANFEGSIEESILRSIAATFQIQELANKNNANDNSNVEQRLVQEMHKFIDPSYDYFKIVKQQFYKTPGDNILKCRIDISQASVNYLLRSLETTSVLYKHLLNDTSVGLDELASITLPNKAPQKIIQELQRLQLLDKFVDKLHFLVQTVTKMDTDEVETRIQLLGLIKMRVELLKGQTKRENYQKEKAILLDFCSSSEAQLNTRYKNIAGLVNIVRQSVNELY